MNIAQKEKLVYNILDEIDSNNKNINAAYFGIDDQLFWNVSELIRDKGLIKDIIFPLDMKISYEISNITLDGIEYLKQKPRIIENEIIQILYDNIYDKALSAGQIKKEISFHLKHNQVEAYLICLRDKGFINVENKRIPAYKNPVNKNLSTPASTYKEYRISQKGIELVENGFITPTNRNIVIEKISEIADNTAKTNELLESITLTFDMTLNALGAQNQKIIRMQIETNNYVEQYCELLKSKDLNKGDKIVNFLKSLSGEVVIGLIAEASKKLII